MAATWGLARQLSWLEIIMCCCFAVLNRSLPLAARDCPKEASLLTSALKKGLSPAYGCPCRINTTMKREDPRWDVQAAFACTFYVLCQRFELDGLLKLAKRGSEVDVVASRLEDDIHSSSRRLASLSPPRSGPPSPGGRWNPSGAGERWEMK